MVLLHAENIKDSKILGQCQPARIAIDTVRKCIEIVFHIARYKLGIICTLLHYRSLPFTSVVGSESRPSSRGIFVT